MKTIKDILIIILIIGLGLVAYKVYLDWGKDDKIKELENKTDVLKEEKAFWVSEAIKHKKEALEAKRQAKSIDSLRVEEQKKSNKKLQDIKAELLALEKKSKNKQVNKFISNSGYDYQSKKYKGDWLIKFPTISFYNKVYYRSLTLAESNSGLMHQVNLLNSEIGRYKTSLISSESAFKSYEKALSLDKKIISSQKIIITEKTKEIKKAKILGKILAGIGALLVLLK